MTLRLAVVSAIACLGLSLPSTERLERWWRGGADRDPGQLAGWDAGDGDRFVIVADALEVGPRVPAVVEVPAAVEGSVVTARPNDDEDVAERSAVVEGSVATARPNDEQDSAAVTAEWLSAAAYEAAPPADSAIEATAMVLPEPSVAPVLPAAEALSEQLLAEWEEARWEEFLTETAWPAESPAEPAAAVLAANPVDDQAFSAVVEELVESFAQDVAIVAAAPRVPAFEPMEIGDDSQDVAYVLNRAAEGLVLPEPAVVAAPARRADRFSHAMRLTREAVNAWASLLHGPALVTLGR